ncbi:MAG TPA: anaerobic ribonucleoside-triphosphate reductase [bacterium]|nr:anaerobic ribonucleoside-triphosphate reductase [bacterium]HNS47945.1 anaerobic ribonucleoside-triphosphate reductase [bacterium]
MSRKDFEKYLSENPDQFSFTAREENGAPGLEVKNSFYDTVTFFSNRSIDQRGLNELVAATHAGRNVEHITRVTGYFSKVSGWNKGKVAELIERHRNQVN